MNAILDILNSLLTGQPVSLGVIAGAIVTFVLSRIFGKHFDELYTWLFRRKSPQDRIIGLQQALIEATQRAEDNRLMAEKFINMAHRLRWELVSARREIARLSGKNEKAS